jgi:hypothetical protein
MSVSCGFIGPEPAAQVTKGWRNSFPELRFSICANHQSGFQMCDRFPTRRADPLSLTAEDSANDTSTSK